MLDVDQQIDRYRVESVLGQGGMAIVYRVVHTQLDSYHAVKVLTISSRGITERLLQEGKVQAQLRHPNIVAVTDVLEVDGKPGLVMEYVDGPALDEWLEGHSPDLAEAERLFRGIVSGVAHAHKAGVIHRDLKPANVMLFETAEGYVPKVADFGLAKALEADPGMHKTRSGVTMGTPAYMAPEQIRDSKHVDARADVFSLGCILYQLVCGRHAFSGPDVLSIFNAVASGEFAPPDSLIPDLPARIQNAIHGALVVDRDRRIQSCEELLEILDGAPLDLPEDDGAAQTWAGELDEQQLASLASVKESAGDVEKPAARQPSEVPTPASLSGTLQPDESRPPRRGRAALLFGVGGMGLLGGGVVVVLLLALVGGFFWARSMGTRVDRTLSVATGGALRHQGVKVRPGGMRIDGLTLKADDGSEWLTASALRLRGQPWTISGGQFRVNRAILDGARIQLHKEDGAWVMPDRALESWNQPASARAGGTIGTLTLPEATLVAETDDGALTVTGTLTFQEAVLGRGPKGGVFTADSLEITDLEVADDDTHLVLAHGLLEDGEAELEGLEAWVRLRTDGAIDVPPVIADGVARWAGGSSREPIEDDWQGLPLHLVPVLVSEIHARDSSLTLVDRANAVKGVSWTWTTDRANFGPLDGDVMPFTVGGRVEEGRLSLEGDWRRDGLVRGTLSLRDLPVEDLAPYVESSLREHGVAVAGGSLDGTLDFGAQASVFKGVYEGTLEGVTMEEDGETTPRGRRLLGERDETVELELEGDLTSRDFAPLNAILHETADAIVAPLGGVRDWRAPEGRPEPEPRAAAPRPAPAAEPVPSAPRPMPQEPDEDEPPEQAPDNAPDKGKGPGEEAPAETPDEGEGPADDDETPEEDGTSKPVEKINRDVREALDKLRLPRLGGGGRR